MKKIWLVLLTLIGFACAATPTEQQCDADGDGYMVQAEACAKPAQPQDCDDNNKAVAPNMTELCDKLDNNCNGQVDEGDVCKKSDRDGDGEPDSTDCAPDDKAKYHGADELCTNDIDDDCDGKVDGDDNECKTGSGSGTGGSGSSGSGTGNNSTTSGSGGSTGSTTSCDVVITWQPSSSDNVSWDPSSSDSLWVHGYYTKADGTVGGNWNTSTPVCTLTKATNANTWSCTIQAREAPLEFTINLAGKYWSFDQCSWGGNGKNVGDTTVKAGTANAVTPSLVANGDSLSCTYNGQVNIDCP